MQTHRSPEDRNINLKVVCLEPYRLFFPLGILWGFVGVSHWIWFRLGFTQEYNPLYHGLMQIQGFGASFAVGFLMTALPRFVDAQPAHKAELFMSLALLLATNLALVMNQVLWSQIFFMLLMAHLMVYALRRFARRRSNPPTEFVFVLSGFTHALVGSFFIFHPLPGFVRLGERMVEQGMLLSFVLGIGTFLGTRLLGLFNAPTQTVTIQSVRDSIPPMNRKKLISNFVLAAALFASFWIESGVSALAGKLLRALVVTAQLGFVAGLYRFPKRPFTAVYFLWISFWCIAFGLWLSAVWPAYEIAWLHFTFIGGFGLMILMIGMRVTLAHGGFEEVWQKNKTAVSAIGGGCLLSLAFRVASVFFLPSYTTFLAVGALCWDVALCLWAIAIVPKMAPSHHQQ